MKAALLRLLLFCTGLALVMWAVLPVGVTPAGAAPRLAVTETSTAEPATPTATAAPTDPPIPTPTSLAKCCRLGATS